jgi:hypothetical protein
MRRTWLRPLLGACGLLSLLGLVVGGWWFSAERQYSANLTKMRSLGYATSLSDLGSKTGDQNALDFYKASESSFITATAPSSIRDYDEFNYIGNDNWTASDSPDFARKFKARFGKYTSSLKPALNIPAQWTPEYRTDYSGATSLRLQAGTAIAEIREKHYDDALDAFELLCKMSSDFLSTPFPQHYGTGEYGARHELEVLQILLPVIQSDEPRLARLNKILDALPPVPSFESAMRGEFAHLLDLISDREKLEEYMSSEVAKRVKKDSVLSTDFGMRMLTRKAGAELAKLVSEAPKDDWRAFDEYWTEVSSQHDSRMNDSVLDHIFHQELRLRTGASYAKALTYRRLGKLAAGVLLDRARGKYPPDVASFGELAQDPFGADAFQHVFGPSSMLIYSLDYNGKDDGGDGPKDDPRFARQGKGLDIVVQIPLSPQ